MTYRILDLYCGAGAVSRGLVRAGFEVVGVDLEPQPRYPYAFLQADATALDARFLRFFDAVWASPPCQSHTALKHAQNARVHVDLIPATRKLLRLAALPYVIENVEGAPLRDPVRLCGSMFGLGAYASGVRYQLQRHRIFETNFPLVPPRPCAHTSPTIGIYGGHVRNRGAGSGGRGTRDFVGVPKKPLALAAMGIDYPQTMDEISQAIPPAYSAWIGRKLREHLEATRVGDERQ